MIKIATETDIPRIRELSYNFFKASPYRDMEMSYVKQGAVITQLLEAYPKTGIILTFWVDGVIQGILAASVTEILFSDSSIASEIAWWVEPKFRGKKGSLELWSAYEWWAENVSSANIVQMTGLEDENIEKVAKFYKRKGYIPVERGFIKHIGRN